MKLVRLFAENIKRLKAVEIVPKGAVVEIRGKNGAGKSSVLDSLCMAIGGKSASPSKPIRIGEEEAVVVAEFDDLVIRRRWRGDLGARRVATG